MDILSYYFLLNHKHDLPYAGVSFHRNLQLVGLPYVPEEEKQYVHVPCKLLCAVALLHRNEFLHLQLLHMIE